MAKTFLLIGGNLGNRLQNLADAKQLISERIGTIAKESSIYESEPWGFESDKNFMNQVVIVDTKLNPAAIMLEVSYIENALGRERKGTGFCSRTMDVDILFYDQQILLTPSLIIPHKFLHQRMFVLKPLLEISPDFVHPLFSVTIQELTTSCSDQGKVWKYQQSEVEVNQ